MENGHIYLVGAEGGLFKRYWFPDRCTLETPATGDSDYYVICVRDGKRSVKCYRENGTLHYQGEVHDA